MIYEASTKDELISELIKLRQRNQELEIINCQKCYSNNNIPNNKKFENLINLQEHKLNLQRLEALVKLNEMHGASLREITDFFYQEGIRLTRSEIGYLGLVNNDENIVEVHAYSPQTIGQYSITNETMVFSIKDGGIWAEAIRQGRPIIVNDYSADNPYKKGLPDGHAMLTRILVVPIFSDGCIVALNAVANKPVDYNESDIYQLRLLTRSLWDIIWRRKSEEKLRNSEGIFYKAFHSSAVMMSISKLEDNALLEVNRSWVRVIGYSREEVIGRTPIELGFWSDPLIRENYINQLNLEGKVENIEVSFCTKDGEIRTGILSAELLTLGSVPCRIENVTDITERKLLEQNLLYSEERYRAMFENSPDAIMLTRPTGTILDVNSAGCRIFGWTKEEICTMGRTGLVDMDDIKTINAIKERDETGRAQSELTYIRKNGTRFQGETTSKLFKAVDGQILTSLIIRDISDRKQAEETLRQSEEKFSKAFHGGPIMMTLATVVEGKFIDANEALCSSSGYTREEIIGRTSKELNFFVDMDKRQKLGKMLLEQGRIENAEIDFRTKSGEIRHGLSWSQLFYLDGHPCHITGLIDVTEQKRIQKEMAKLDRLNLLGQMAASIAHEIRNPLTTVRGFLQLFKARYNKDLRYINLMIEELDRANTIITEFLSVANIKIVKLIPKNLNLILENIIPLIQASATIQEKEIKLELMDVPAILLDEEEMRQLILNTVNNGLESMSAGGNITIRTFIDNENVVLSIQDQGKGVDPEILDKLGTPFITTKDQGTGLGLAVCYGIATRHNAIINIDTSSNGTTFFVRFPIQRI